MTENFKEGQQGILYCNHTEINMNAIDNITWILYPNTLISQFGDLVTQDNERLIFKNLSRSIYNGYYSCFIYLKNQQNALQSDYVQIFVGCK